MDYDKKLTPSILSVKPSGIRRFFDIVNEMEDVISLSVGEPDFQTPWHVRQAGIRSLERGRTWYTPNRGFKELRTEIANFYKRKYNIEYDPADEVVVTVGGSEAIDIAIRCMAGAGDEVLIPQPSFVCYEPLTVMAGATPVVIETKVENAFRLTAEEIEEKITDRTKLLILPFPNNPTGAIMTKEDLEGIAEVLDGTDILVISDEIYCELTYGRDHVSIASLPGMRERTVVASGFSKSYAMTGWRLGYTLAPAEITKQMLKIHQYAIMCAPTASQFAAVQAMRHGDPDVAEMRAEYNRRRRYLVGGLQEMGIDCFHPEGAFYVWPNISKFGMSSEVFCRRLMEEGGVVIVPGTAFGKCGEGFARISYAYSVEHIAKALDRIEKFISSL